MSSCERLLQLTMKRITKWADENSLKFPTEKTIVISLCLRRGLFPDPTVPVSRVKIVVKTERLFLAVIFDKKLALVPHLKHLNKKYLKSSNILKALYHKSWGAVMKRLICLYNALVRSRPEYGTVCVRECASV